MTPIRVAAVGAGYFSQFQYEAWHRLPGADVVAICNRSRGKAEATAAKYGIPAVFDDLPRMLDEVKPDLVDIITPPETHLDSVRECAARGLAMVCQKPFTPTLAEAREAVRIAEDAGVTLLIHENYRWQPWYREMHRMLAAGVLGVPRNITFRLRPGDGQGPRAYLDRQPYFQQMPRFMVHETAIHGIDTFRYLMGEVRGVFARLRKLNPVIAGEDAGLIAFDFDSGAAGLFDGNRLVDHAAENRRLTLGEMWLEGDAAVLRLDGDGGLHLRRHGENDEEAWGYEWRNVSFGGDCIYDMQAHFIAHLTSGAPVENTGRDYLRNIEIEDAVYRSSDEGRYVTL
jgi:predicted dehydrogenase